MAEKKTITISSASAFTRCVRDYRGISGTTYYTTSGNKTPGFNYSSESSEGIQDGRVHCDIYSYLPDKLKAADTAVTSLAVTIYGYRHNESTMDPSVSIGVSESIFGGTDEQKFEICSNAPTYSSGNIVSSSSETVIVKIYNSRFEEETKKQILRNGIVVRVPRGSTYGKAWVVITKIVLDVEFFAADSPPDIKITTPAYGSTVSADVAVTDGFQTTWEFIQSSGVTQSGYQILYKYIPIEGETLREMTPIISGSAKSHFITPEQLPQMRSDLWSGGYNDSVCFCVKGYIQNNSVSSEFDDNAGEYSWRILRLYFPRPYDLYPTDQSIVLADDPIELSWKIKFGSEATGKEVDFTNYPSEFDIEYSSNVGETWNTIASQATVTRQGEVYSYTVPGNTFPGGVIMWRVRAYAGGKTIETYESGAFQVRVQASTSSVMCDGKPRPTVSWSSSAQIAYQVRFAEYDSGAIYGAKTSHTVPFFYSDGVYPVQVRTQASDGVWSAWTELEYVTLTNSEPDGILSLNAQITRHTVVLAWESTTDFDKFILYRNNIPVYIGNNFTYTDIAAYGMCSYYVRGISGSDYLQTKTVVILAKPATDCMYDTKKAQWIPLKYSLQPRNRSYSETAGVTYKFYAGRQFPVAYIDGTIERKLTVSYVFRTRDEAELLKSSLGHLVIYKDTSGSRIIGVLADISWDVTRRFAAVMTIIQTDYTEEVRYET